MSANLTNLSLFKRSNGIYYILFQHEGKRRWKSTNCTVKCEALRALMAFETLFESSSKPASLSKFTSEYLEHARVNHAKGTVEIARIALDHLRTVAGDLLLSSLTYQHLDRYKSKRLTEVSPVSVNVELRALRSILNVALRWNLIETNPFSKMQLVRTPDNPPSYLSKDHFQALLAIVKESWMKEVVVFAVLTGMRRGEIVNLRWQDVDLSRRVIHIQSSPTFRTKQGKRRTIPLGEVASQLLLSKATKVISEYVFTKKGTKIVESWLTHRFKSYVRTAKLGEQLHFHSLRHTFASWLVQDGVSIYEVQKLLGHASISVTQMYSHLQPEQLHNTVNRIQVTLN